MDIAIAFQKPEYWNLATSTAPAFALSAPPKVALVQFNLTTELGRVVLLNLFIKSLAEFVENRIAVLRFTPDNSAAKRAVTPAQKYLISSI